MKTQFQKKRQVSPPQLSAPTHELTQFMLWHWILFKHLQHTFVLILSSVKRISWDRERQRQFIAWMWVVYLGFRASQSAFNSVVLSTDRQIKHSWWHRINKRETIKNKTKMQEWPSVPFVWTASEVKGKTHPKTELTHDVGQLTFDFSHRDKQGFMHVVMSTNVLDVKVPLWQWITYLWWHWRYPEAERGRHTLGSS